MTLTAQEIESRIASKSAIEHHYDVGNDFFALWLDSSTMAYTAGIHDLTNPNETLDEAQLRKLDHHAQAIQIKGKSRVLDIGCGWGGFLNRAMRLYGVKNAVGLTLSSQQKDWIQQHYPDVECRLESWVDHQPEQRYDGIVSVEAFEAFARPQLTSAEKTSVYREFFKRCSQWLQPDGMLSLQLIPYGNATPEEFNSFISEDIFPESNFPRMIEVFGGFEYLFEVVAIENHRDHYIQTLRHWRNRLRQHRKE
ncbi:class I SAM-dependent methyltransferase, partial [bacterium]|nr:class I SAM-dependent methyltransferase [bacterium]